jgi:hypothetical protein
LGTLIELVDREDGDLLTDNNGEIEEKELGGLEKGVRELGTE